MEVLMSNCSEQFILEQFIITYLEGKILIDFSLSVFLNIKCVFPEKHVLVLVKKYS